MVIEISFPRGGRKPPENSKPKDFTRDYDLFGKKRKKIVKHPGKSNIIQPVAGDDLEEQSIQYVQQLTGKSIQEGMVLIGCVKEIQKVALGISLPGRLFGKVLINNISNPYTKLLQTVVEQNESDEYKPLSDIFSLGQCVAVKILNLNDEKFGITLSLMPQQINSNISNTNISVGMTLTGAISEIEDHGYVVDLGIQNCRAFLKKEYCDPKTNYAVGQLLWLVVTQANISSTATTVILSAQTKKIQNTRLLNNTSLDHLLPGMQIDFTISQVLSNGIEGYFFNDYTGYIEITELLNKTLRSKKSEYKPDVTLQARIVYIMPVTKIVYFTLKDLNCRKKGIREVGTILNCSILRVTPFGIHTKLGNSKRCRGFVPFNRAPKNTDNEYKSDYHYFKQKYYPRTVHKCRILNYDYYGQFYVCTLEKEYLKNDLIYTLDDLKIGMLVSAEIKEIQPNGLLVKIDQVNGYIRNEHICDSVVTNYNIFKSRMKVGQKIQARVWLKSKSKNVLYLTIKPSLVKSDIILDDYSNVQINQQYLGIIKKITDKGLLILFFGDVHGWVPARNMSFGNKKDLDSLFKVGQLIKCTAVKRRNRKLTLNLQSSTEIAEDIKPELNLGEHVTGIVIHITNEAIHVEIKDCDIKALVPILYLSKFPKLAPVFAKMYRIGEEIPNLVCVSTNDILPTLSLRNPELNEDNIKEIENLRKGHILPCNVAIKDSFGLSIEAPVKNLKKNIFVPIENILENYSLSNIKINQLIHANIFHVSKNFEAIIASIKLTDVWDFDIQSSVQYFSTYLKEVLQIRDYFKALKNPVASLDLGEKVTGVITSINDNKSCTVLLENGATASVAPEHIKENIKINDKVEGVVLFWDFENNLVDVALCPKLISRINHIQNGNINIPAGVTNKSSAHAEVILVKDDFILGVLRGAAGKRQFVFFPARLHPNDLKPNLDDYIIGDYIKIQVDKIENGIVIGLLKQLIKDMNYKCRQSLKKKRKLDINNEQIEGIKTEKIDETEVKKKKKKIKKEPITEYDFNFEIKEEKLSDDETETQKNNGPILLKEHEIKREKKTSFSTDDESREDTVKIKSKKVKKPIMLSDEKSLQNNKNNKIERKKKTSVSTDDEAAENIRKSKIETKKKKNSCSENEETVEHSRENKEKRKRKNSVADGEIIENIVQNKKGKLLNKEITEKTEQSNKGRKKKTSISSDEVTTKDNQKSKVERTKKNKNSDNEIKDMNKKEKRINKTSTSENKIGIFSAQKKNNKRKNDDTQDEISTNKQEQKKTKLESLNIKKIAPVLPGADNFWNLSEKEDNAEESSDDEEIDQKELEKLQKKRRITPAEKAELARLEEERIRKIELELADAESVPKTADQFDRLVLANPNNSMFWINYMAFHLEATEIEKARAVARKALNTIIFREEQERLNVWIAFLNLENRYGTKESFANVLSEAVKMNDALTVYLQALNILSDSNKTSEFLDLVRTVSKKFKQDSKMWIGAAEACYKCNLKEEARNLMQKSLISLEEKHHVNILVQFAFMESRFNEPERAESLLEKVLASYPRRVDVWTSYVDMLIKNNRTHIARNVLERAISQKLPARKMKTLFSKFIQFETKYGNEENVKKIRQLAADYVKSALN